VRCHSKIKSLSTRSEPWFKDSRDIDDEDTSV
jgi:hypothetical protein